MRDTNGAVGGNDGGEICSSVIRDVKCASGPIASALVALCGMRSKMRFMMNMAATFPIWKMRHETKGISMTEAQKAAEEAAILYCKLVAPLDWTIDMKDAFIAGYERGVADSEARVKELETKLARCIHINKKFKTYGTDGCKSCGTGRVTLFIANDECISCNPESYELVTPEEAQVKESKKETQ